MVQKLINILLYAGVDQASFEAIKPKIRSSNRIMTVVLSSFATLLILAMTITSFKETSVDQNRAVYKLGLILSILILLTSATIARKCGWIITPLVHISYFIYYMYGIMIGAITDPTGKTVTFMVLLVFLPTLFVDKPFYSIIITTFYVTLFVLLCYIHKTGDVLSVDIMDAIIYGILGAASGIVISHMKVRGYLSEYQLQSISRLDQLTGMQNQNAFKLDMAGLAKDFRQSLACVYIDVNGLHDLNNKEGHEKGDQMLQFIAQTLMNFYGFEKTYRIGGDEFIAYAYNIDQEDLVDKISDTVEAIERQGYSIAVGYEITHTRHFIVEDFINAAELRMREDKKRYKSRS